MGPEEVFWALMLGLVLGPLGIAAAVPLARAWRWRAVHRALVEQGFTRHLGGPAEGVCAGWHLRFHRQTIQRGGRVFSGRFVLEIPLMKRVFRCVSRTRGIEKHLWPGEPEPTGDPVFDHLFGIFGPPIAWVPTLDSETRARLIGLAGDWLRLDRGIEVLFRRPPSPAEVAALTTGLARLATCLTRPFDGPTELARLATTDPAPGVRARCLGLLFAEFPRSSELLAAASACLFDADPAVRLAAAQALDDAAVLQALATDRTVPPELRSAALLHLVPRSARDLFTAATHDEVVARAAWRALALVGGPLPLEGLALPPVGDTTIRAAAAAALALAGPPAEPHLLALLADPDYAVATAAAEALGQVGTSRSVGPLRARTPNFIFAGAPRLQRAIRHSLALLETPVGAGGALSLAAGEGGGLSEAEDPP